MFNLSDFITPAITVAVGLIAYVIYLRQKRDKKRDAANILLIELENAEKQLQTILKHSTPSELQRTYTMPNHSWDKYKYLFVKDFSTNEWDKLTEFYGRCLKYDKAVEYDESFFKEDVVRLRDNAHRVIADIAAEFTNEFPEASSINDAKDFTPAHKMIVDKYNEKRQTFEEFYESKRYFYSPVQPINEATNALRSLETNLSLTTIGMKLKKLSKESIFSKLLSRIGL